MHMLRRILTFVNLLPPSPYFPQCAVPLVQGTWTANFSHVVLLRKPAE
jgi:hypothetical protein